MNIFELEGARRAEAIEIAIRAEVLERCEFHEECVYEGNQDIHAAYRIASHEFAQGQHTLFSSQSELTDCIKHVVEEHPADDCQSCEKMLDN